MAQARTATPDSDRGSSAAGMLPGSPALHRRRLGAELRRLRQEHCIRLEDAAAHIDVRPSTLSRIETGQAPTRTSYLSVLLDLYGVDDPGQRAHLAGSAREGQRRDWLADCADLLGRGTCRYLGLEATASGVRAYSALAIPGLVQTADYAAAAYRATRPDLTARQIARLAGLQARRQESLGRDGRQVYLIIDEAALIRPVAPVPVITGQLRHLIEMASSAAVTVQVAGPAAARAVLSPALTILTFDGDGDGDADAGVACCDGIGGQVIMTTRAGDVRAAHATFRVLARAALAPARSVELIEKLARG